MRLTRLEPGVSGRREPRFATSLPVKLESGEGRARNVSANGIYFLTDAPCEAGAAIKFTLSFRDFPGGPIAVDCLARVVRVEPQGPQKGVGAAIRQFEFYRVQQKQH